MKAMILAAGRGTRVRPLTDRLPKPMIPIIHKPVMEMLVDHLASHGFDEIMVNTSYLAPEIENYFRDGQRFGVQMAYSFEGHVEDDRIIDAPVGSAGALQKIQQRMLGLAEHHTTDPKLRDYLKRAEQSAKRLMSTLNGLVDLAATEANRLTLERAPLRIIDVIDKALADQQETARAKGLTLALENPESARLAPDFMGDALRIHQIIDELISNAIKFSPSGTIRVRTGAIRNAAGAHELQCTVSDEGIGIAAEPLAHIFDPFWQAEEAMWHGYDGKGIGLALCQRLARAMGGNLTVESTPGQGSRFTLIIPLQLADEAPESIRADALARLKASYAGASVLAAEDDEINLAILTDYLDEAGISVFGVSNGAEAVEAAKAACFDLILMDLMMPVMSGIEATHAIRDLPKYGKTPIVAVTACVFENDREECLRAGMTDFVRKPVIPEVLYEVILSAFEESQAASIAHMNAA